METSHKVIYGVIFLMGCILHLVAYLSRQETQAFIDNLGLY